MMRSRLFLQLSEAQSTGLRCRRPPANMAAKWSFGLPIKKSDSKYYLAYLVSNFKCKIIEHSNLIS